MRMLPSYRAELMKLRKRAAVWILLAVFIFLGVLFSYLIPAGTYLASNGTADLKGGDTAGSVILTALPNQLVVNSISALPLFGGAIAVIFGALVVGSEYGWDTAKTISIQGPTRTALSGAKDLALVTATFIAVLCAYAAGYLATWVIALWQDKPLDWPSVTTQIIGFLAGWLVLTVWALFGAALAALTRGLALAIGLGLVWLLIFGGFLTGLIGGLIPGLRPVLYALPGSAAGSLTGALTDSVRIGGGMPGVNSDISSAGALIALLVYLVVFALAAHASTLKRDIA